MYRGCRGRQRAPSDVSCCSVFLAARIQYGAESPRDQIVHRLFYFLCSRRLYSKLEFCPDRSHSSNSAHVANRCPPPTSPGLRDAASKSERRPSPNQATLTPSREEGVSCRARPSGATRLSARRSSARQRRTWSFPIRKHLVSIPPHEVPHFSVCASNAPRIALCSLPVPTDAARIIESHIALKASRRPGRSQGGDRFHGPATIADCRVLARRILGRQHRARTGPGARPPARSAGARAC
jgi:hypothetical protein